MGHLTNRTGHFSIDLKIDFIKREKTEVNWLNVSFLLLLNSVIYLLQVKTSHEVCKKTKVPSLSFAETAEKVFEIGPPALRKYSYFARYVWIWNLIRIYSFWHLCLIFTLAIWMSYTITMGPNIVGIFLSKKVEIFKRLFSIKSNHFFHKTNRTLVLEIKIWCQFP